MRARNSQRATAICALILTAGLTVVIAACGPAGGTAVTAPPTAGPGSTGSGASAPLQTATAATGSSPAESQAADVGTTSGDVPDNAVFLTYRDPKLGFSVQYVEGWQVSSVGDGVSIRDKDSSETVQVVSGQSDVAGYVASTDLPALKAQTGFALIKEDKVAVGGTSLVHLAYHLPAPPDPVTGKQVSSTVDRYYVPGPTGLAVVSLSTPDGVDNVDAFRQMIESFRWA